MAEYYATVTNGRRNAKPVNVGGISSVAEAHIRGWDAGVKVVPVRGAGNMLCVKMTHGSHGGGTDVILGHVILNDDGRPEFIPWPNPLPH